MIYSVDLLLICSEYAARRTQRCTLRCTAQLTQRCTIQGLHKFMHQLMQAIRLGMAFTLITAQTTNMNLLLSALSALVILQVISIPHADKLLLLMRTHSYHDSMIIGRSIRSNLLNSNPLRRSIFNPLKEHDATKDDQYALSQWLRMPVSEEKLLNLKNLLQNPTVDFKIQDTLKYEFYSLMRHDRGNRDADPRRLGQISSVVDQAAELGDFEVLKGLQDKGLKLKESTLYAAAKSGNLLLVRYLIEMAKIKVNELTLLSSIIGGHNDITKYLVDIQRCKVTLISLNVAAEVGDWKIITFLLRNLDKDLIKNIASLHLFVLKPAARAGKIDIIKVMLRRDGKVLNNPDYTTFMSDLLEEGCNSGSYEMVEFLINKTGLIPNLKCLENAIKSGDPRLVTILTNTYKLEPTQEMFDETVHVFNRDLMVYLMQSYFFKASYPFVLKAAELGDVYFMEFLIVEFQLVPDMEALEKACIFGQFQMVQFLNQEIQLVPNIACLNHAAWSGNVELFDYLVINSGHGPNSLTLRFACLGADEDLKRDHSEMINHVKGIFTGFDDKI